MIAVIDTIHVLENQAALPAYIASSYLENSAMDHCNDIIVNNVFSHTSSDGATLKERIERYAEWRGSLAENMDFGSSDPMEIVVNLLIDDGVASKGHRKNILSPGKSIKPISN